MKFPFLKPSPPPPPGSGPGPDLESLTGFAPRNARTGREIKLALQDLFLTGRILATGARLAIRHTFVSAESASVEIVYAFVLPRDAALRRFRIAGDGFTAHSELQPAEEAQQAYEDGIERGHLSTLARQYRDGYVNLTVGNVRPGETVTVHLDFLAGVDLRDDGLRFRFPFTLAPCDHAGMKAVRLDDNTGELELPETEFGDVLLPPFVKDAAALHRVGFDLSVQMPGPIAETGSPSHAVRVGTLDPRRARVRLAPDHDLPNRDLVLDVRLAAPYSGVLCGQDKDGRRQMAAVIASDRFGQAGKDPRRLVFLLDRSGSMGGEPIRQARNAVLACLGALAASDQVGLIAFDDKIERFRDALADTDAPTRDALRTFLDKVAARGGTELFRGLDAAAALLGQDGGDIFVLTDGQVAGTDTVIRKAAALGIRVHCLGIGSASQDRFLAQLARETGGLSRFVTPRERVDTAALELFAVIGRPVAAAVTVTPRGLDDARLAPAPADAVFGGHPLVVYGESAPGTGSLEVAWTRDGQPRTLALPVSAADGADADTLRLLRGARLITDLESRLGGAADGDAAGQRDRQRLERALEELGRIYGLANRRLSLVAVVERKGDKAGDPPRTSVVPVGMPQDTEWESYVGRLCVQAPPMRFRCCNSAPDMASRLGGMDASRHVQFSLAPPEPQRDAMDLCMDLAGRIAADGGLPGKTDADRICRTLVVLLALREHPSPALFAPHCARLLAFLDQADLTRLDDAFQEVVRQVVDRARRNVPVPGRWAVLAVALIVTRRTRAPAAWRALQKAVTP